MATNIDPLFKIFTTDFYYYYYYCLFFTNIGTFKSTSRHLFDILNIYNDYFDQIVDKKLNQKEFTDLSGSIGCAVRLETSRSRVQAPPRSATFFREIFSTVILSLPLIQEGQLSVSGERMCTILVNRLED